MDWRERHQRRAEEALQQPEGHDLEQRLRDAAQHRGDHEAGDRHQQHALAAEPVGEEARRRRHDRGGDDIGGQHPVDLVGARRHAALDIGQRDIGDRRVERLHDDGKDDAGGDRAAVGDRLRSGAAASAMLQASPIRSRPVMKLGKPRAWPVSTLTSTLMPTRSGGLPGAVVDADAHRNALHDLDPVAAGVLRRQQREARGGGRADAVDRAGPSLARIGVDVDRHLLAGPDIGQLGLLRARLDPDVIGRDDAEGAAAAARY